MIPKLLKRFDFLAVPLFILFLFALTYRGILGLPMMAMMDLPAFPLHGMSALQLRDFVSSWQCQGLGRAIDFDYRELFFAALAALLRDNGEVTQKVYYLSLLPVATLSMYFLLRLVGVRSRFARVVGALVYGINPITIGQFTGAPGQLVTIALLPLLLIGAFEVAERNATRSRGTLLLAATIAIITSFNPYFPLIIAPLILLAWVQSLILTPGKPLGYFPAFYQGNGYYVDQTGVLQVRLSFDRQPARNLQILVSAIGWAIVEIGMLFLSVKGMRDRRGGTEQQ